MKIRQGFVSNSSASSFIIAIGKIIDREKFDKFIETIDMRVISGFKITSVGEIADDGGYMGKISRDGKNIKLEAFTGAEVSMSKEAYDKADEGKDMIQRAIMSLAEQFTDDIILWQTSSEDIGYDEDSGEYNYDIDLDHFSEDEQNLFEGLKEENGIVLVEKTFGAGYNG